MSWYEAIMWVAGLLGAVGVIYKTVKPIRKAVDDLVSVKSDIQTLLEHDKENYLSILRLSLMNENLPLSERIIAGDKYIKAGGNGDCKHFYFQLLKEHTK